MRAGLEGGSIGRYSLATQGLVQASMVSQFKSCEAFFPILSKINEPWIPVLRRTELNKDMEAESF